MTDAASGGTSPGTIPPGRTPHINPKHVNPEVSRVRCGFGEAVAVGMHSDRSQAAGALRDLLFLAAALILSGCVLNVPAVIQPDTEPGSDYYQGYIAGSAFADDGWKHIGAAATWLDQNSLTATDVGIQKALMNLPPSIVEDHTAVWVEAFRAGASTRFDQYRTASFVRGDKATRLTIVIIGLVAFIVVLVATSIADG